MASKAIHTVLTEAQLSMLADTDPAMKVLLDQYRAESAAGKNVIIITDRHGKPLLQEVR